MNNTLIVTGGRIDYSFAKSYIAENCFKNIIAVDKGLEFLHSIELDPNYIVGDFDTVNVDILNKYANNKNIEIHKFNPEKDYTDTDIAIKLAINIKSEDIIIIGATGTRIDHLMGNINALNIALNSNIPCKLIDTNNRIQLINNKLTIEKQNEFGKYISLIPLTSKAEGITLKGFKYTLNNATLEIGQTMGISNELSDNTGEIELKKGILILIESKD